MSKIIKLFTSSLLAVCLSVATVMCCCSASSAVAHFHKTAMCGHCSDKGPHNTSSSPVLACKYQLTSAEFSNTQVIPSSVVSGVTFSAPIFFDKHITTLPSPVSLACPPGSSPLGISFTPLYLRTFNLRI